MPKVLHGNRHMIEYPMVMGGSTTISLFQPTAGLRTYRVPGLSAGRTERT